MWLVMSESGSAVIRGVPTCTAFCWCARKENNYMLDCKNKAAGAAVLEGMRSWRAAIGSSMMRLFIHKQNATAVWGVAACCVCSVAQIERRHSACAAQTSLHKALNYVHAALGAIRAL